MSDSTDSAVVRLNDWIDIFDAHDQRYGDEVRAVFELQPSELDRLRHDLKFAVKALETSEKLVRDYDAHSADQQRLLEKYSAQLNNVMSIARRAVDTLTARSALKNG